MVKKQLIECLAEKLPQLSKQDTETIVKTIVEQLSDAICNGERVEIRGFGAFTLHHRNAAQIRNPKSGETIIIAEKYKVHFKPGLDLRNKVNS